MDDVEHLNAFCDEEARHLAASVFKTWLTALDQGDGEIESQMRELLQRRFGVAVSADRKCDT